MIAVIFEFTPAPGRFPDYMALVETLKPELAKAEGFISLERFESITTPGKFVSLQFWRDEESVAKWRNLQKHREAQKKGRGGIFASYRLRIAGVIRDYTHGRARRGARRQRCRAWLICVEHTFLLKEGLWRSEGEFFDGTGKRIGGGGGGAHPPLPGQVGL